MARDSMMGGLADPGLGNFMLPPEAPSWEAEHRYAPQGSEISQGDAYWMSGGHTLPQRSAADAYRMGGLAAMDEYKPNTFREIDRADIEDQYGGADLHGIKLPPVSRDEPKAWFDTIVGETPADAALNLGLGGTGKLAKGALALGGLFKMADPAEALFAGRGAKTADIAKLAAAEKMAAKGASPNDIWTSTGWFKGKDDKWRFEIPDQPAKWNLDPAALNALQTAREPMAMGEAFSHPELMKAYPQLYKADFSVGLQPGNARATYSSGFGVDPPTISIRPDTAASMRSSNLHELQHGIQEIEGFATGGSVFGGLRPGTPEWKIYQDTLERIRTPTPKAELEKSGVLGPEYSYEDYLREHKQNIRGDKLGLDRMAQETAMREAYRRSAGEVEARTVQARDRMTPEQMRDIPWLYQDVPTDQQIVKFRQPLGSLAAQDRYGAAP